MDCFCLKRKHRKRKEKKFRPLSPHVSPTHSQPSTLGQMPDGRLPKVNSTGLWIGTPSLYSGVPSSAYYFSRPHNSGKHRVEPPMHIQRAASETRLPQPRPPFGSSRPAYGSHNNVYLLPVHTGQRIYHSQQLAPVYEVPPSRGMEIYDVYQFGSGVGGPRSKLLETKHSPYYYNNSEFVVSSRLERSKSDAEERRVSRSEHRKQNSNSKHSRSSSHENKSKRSSTKDVSRGDSRKSRDSNDLKGAKSLESLKGVSIGINGDIRGAHVNEGFTSDAGLVRNVSNKVKTAPQPPAKALSKTATLPNGTAGVASTVVTTNDNISPSATDSMKLLAKNKTDDQKKTQPSIMVENDTDKPISDGNDIEHHHYVYQGDIYSVPSKKGFVSNARDEDDFGNPIVSRMKEMVLEKSRTSNPATPRGEYSNPYEIVTTSSSVTQNPTTGIYEEVTKVTKITRSEVIESVEASEQPENSTTTKDVVDGIVLPDKSLLDRAQTKDLPSEGLSSRGAAMTKDTATTSTSAGVKDEVKEPTSPVVLRDMGAVSPRLSIDADGGAEDISKVGKRITASAFEFLDKYLSDDEMADGHIESPPLSPVGMRVEGLVN